MRKLAIEPIQFDLLDISNVSLDAGFIFDRSLFDYFDVAGAEFGAIFNSFVLEVGLEVPPAIFELSSLLAANGGNGSAGFVLNGININDRSGISVSSAGDVNGDGFDDILIGANGGDANGNTNTGESYVVFGSNAGFPASFDLSTINGTQGFVINGIGQGDDTGFSVSSAGDINGDGFDDIIIGARQADIAGNSGAGESYVIFGRGTGFGSSLDLSSLDGTNGFILIGIDAFDFSGSSVSGAGDINGDGFDDVIISAPSASPNGIDDAGESYVVFGSDAGFAATFDLSALDGNNGFVLNGANVDEFSGRSVSGTGDINGDGFDDIIIGAPSQRSTGPAATGVSYVVFGSDAGFSASFDLASLNGTNGFVLNGIRIRDQTGLAVSGAGDVNGDGIDDIIIGAPYAAGDTDSSGQSYVIFGTNAGFGASFDLSTLNGTNGFSLSGIENNDILGWSVSAAGDINGDGFDDVIIGARFADAGGRVSAGESYVIFGSGLGFAPNIDVSTLIGADGFAIRGIDIGDYSGTSVSGAGDINGDGFDDLIIGASAADANGNSSAGESYVIFGSADFGGGGTALTPGNDNFTGTNSAEIIFALPGDDIITALGGRDRINGEAGNDTLRGGSGDDLVNGGDGDDTILGNSGRDTLSGNQGSDLIFGGGDNDIINGNLGDDQLSGQGGNDVIIGGRGNDDIFGGAGADRLRGEDGTDTISAGGGDDFLTGGSGDDNLSGGNGTDTLIGGSGNDAIFGNSQNDLLNGNQGNDTLDGGAGNDTLNGGAGHDIIFGRANQDVLEGNSGDDMLFGNSGGDTLRGGGGDDVIDGGGGNDDLNGGAGADVFVANLGFRTDRVQDFEDGIDVIDFSGNSLANSLADVLAVATQVGANVRIDLNPNNALILENFDLADLDASDFIF